MDNGDKINFTQKSGEEIDRKAEVRLFLNDELLPLQKSREVNSYNLAEEYAETKKNKDSFIWILLGACFIVVVSVTVLTVMYLSKQNKKIAVDAEVFSDLDMRSMLNTRSHAEMNYLVAENTRSRLESERDFKLKQAAIDRDSGLSLTAALRVEDNDKQTAAVRSKYAKQIVSIHAEYDDRLNDAAGEAAQCKQQLDEIDTVGLENVDFTRQVEQHERSLLVGTYGQTVRELQERMSSYQKSESASNAASVSLLAGRYHSEVDALDPVLNDPRADDILKRAAGMKPEPEDISSYVASFPENVLSDDFMAGMSRVQKLFSDYRYLHKAVSGIPQKHSIAGYKTTEDRLVNEISTELGKAASVQITEMYAAIQQLKTENAGLKDENDSLLQSRKELQAAYNEILGEYSGVSGTASMYDVWFEKKASEEKSAGYILDVSDPSAMKVFAVQTVRSELFQGKKDIRVIVYHGKTRKTAEGMLALKDGVCCFIPLNSDDVSKTASGDRFVLKSQ